MRARFAPLLLVFAACAKAPDSSAGTPADVVAITALRDSIQAAETGGRPDGMFAAFAEDVVVMAPGMPALEGKPAATEAMRGMFQAMSMSVQYASAEMVVMGDWAFDRGSYSGTMTPKAGGPATADRGKYLWLLHKGPDGSWKYHRVIWNADAAPPAS
jgi:uncharacterized protein (TIGR02246 family)